MQGFTSFLPVTLFSRFKDENQIIKINGKIITQFKMNKPYNSKSQLKGERGFTLIELVIVIVILGIMSAVVIPKFGTIMATSKINASKGELMVLREAIVGSGDVVSGGSVSSAGYKNDVGESPSLLDDLITKPATVNAWNKYLQMGWNGPYIHDDGNDDYKIDAWGNAYTLTDSTIVSNGLDQLAGGGDDIVVSY